MNPLVVTFDGDAYSVDAVQRALYRMCDRLSGQLAVANATGDIECRLTALDVCPISESLLAEFRNHVLDEVLRARIREETREVRNLVLAAAFAKSGLIEPAAED